MITISIDEIQRDLIGYLHRVQAGETFVVTHADKLLAEIKPVTVVTNPEVKQLRPFGLCKGEFVVPDDFDAPLPEDILSQFENR